MRLSTIVISAAVILLAFGCAKRQQVVETFTTDDATQIVKQGGDQASASHVEQGKALYRKGNYNQAGKHLIRAIANNQENWEAHYYLGLVMQQEGHSDRAIGSFNNCLKYCPAAHPILIDVYYALGESWEKEGYLDKAKEKYQMALAINPMMPSAKAGIARIKDKEIKADAAKNKDRKGAF